MWNIWPYASMAVLVLAMGCGEQSAADAPTIERLLVSSPTHSCAIRRSGIFCWGGNTHGALGNGLTEDSELPVEAIAAGDDVVELAANTGRTCVRRSTGQVACWGANEHGQIGDGTRTDSFTAVTAIGIEDAVALAVDEESTCVIRGERGEVSCWGESPEDEPESGSLLPRAVPGLSGAVELRAGSYSTYCARGEEGWVKCWQLIDGAWTAPAVVPELADARSIAVTSYDQVCGASEAQVIVCRNFEQDITVTLDSSEGSIELVGAGGLGTCALDVQGRWRCWNVPPTPLLNAVEVRSDVPVVELTLAGFRGCALREDDSVVCGDANDFGFVSGAVEITTVVQGLPD